MEPQGLSSWCGPRVPSTSLLLHRRESLFLCIVNTCFSRDVMFFFRDPAIVPSQRGPGTSLVFRDLQWPPLASIMKLKLLNTYPSKLALTFRSAFTSTPSHHPPEGGSFPHCSAFSCFHSFAWAFHLFVLLCLVRIVLILRR